MAAPLMGVGGGRNPAPDPPPRFISDTPLLPPRLPLLWVARGGGGWHEAFASGCLPLGAPIGLSPLLLLTLCGSERDLVVSTRGGGGGGCSLLCFQTLQKQGSLFVLHAVCTEVSVEAGAG